MISDSELLIDALREMDVLKEENERMRNWIQDNCDARERLMTCDDCLNVKCPLNANMEVHPQY